MQFLKRFPIEKHDQIKQLMTYIEMCGVSGKDLVSIGGYIDRRRLSESYKHRKSLVDALPISPVGSDHAHNESYDTRFNYKTEQGTYRFETDGWNTWSITSNKTKVVKKHTAVTRDWPAHLKWRRRMRYEIMLDVIEGNIKLNF